MGMVLGARCSACSRGFSSTGAIPQLLPEPGSSFQLQRLLCIFFGGVLWVILCFKMGYHKGLCSLGSWLPVSCGTQQPPAMQWLMFPPSTLLFLQVVPCQDSAL